MATTKVKKQEILKFLKEEILTQKSAVFLTNGEQNVTAEVNTEFRKKARAEGVGISMIKLNLIKKAFPDFPQEKGQVYVSYKVDTPNEKTDEVSVAKCIVNLLKKDFKDTFSLSGANVNGEYYDVSKTQILADTPTLADSMSMIAGSISQVISKNASLIKEIPAGLARGVNALKDQKA